MKTSVTICILALLLAGCAWPRTGSVTPTDGSPPTAAAVPSAEPSPPVDATAADHVTEIPLSGAVAKPSAEVSGLAWYGDYLILLPQYPDFANGEWDGAIYALPRANLLAYLAGA